MARFILDVMINSDENVQEIICKVLKEVIEDCEVVASTVSTITVIDETNTAQFYSRDGKFTPLMNKLTKQQIENYNAELEKR